MNSNPTRWRRPTPVDAVRGVYCRVNVPGCDPTPTMYRMCGFCKYPNESMVIYVERTDGSRTFFNEENLQVLDESR